MKEDRVCPSNIEGLGACHGMKYSNTWTHLR